MFLLYNEKMKKRKVRRNIQSLLFLLLCFFSVVALVLTVKTKRTGDPQPAKPSKTPDIPQPTSAVSAKTWNIPFSAVPANYEAKDVSEGFSTGWVLQSDYSGSTGKETAEFDRNVIGIYEPGVKMNSILFYRDGIPYFKGNQIDLYFNASSTIERTIAIDAYDPASWTFFHHEEFHLTPEEKTYHMTFVMEGESIWNGQVAFELGNDGHNEGKQHTVFLSGIRVFSDQENVTVHVNQLGYQTGGPKTFTVPYSSGDVFEVINAENNEIAFSGPIVYGRMDEGAGEQAFYGDFSALKQPGTYFIRSQVNATSHKFVISDHPYDVLTAAVIKMLSLQRSGVDLDPSWAKDLAHKASHTALASVYGTDDTRDVSGGWYDAGDYGRYIKTGTKSVADLLLAYLINPYLFTDYIDGPDSNNKVADVLDEARFELEWMLKMQDTDGGVFNKVITQTNAGFIDPSEDNQPLYVLEKETSATGDFAGAMALAAAVFEPIDSSFAAQCLKAAEEADRYLSANPADIKKINPGEISGGTYYDDDDRDCRFFAKAALYAATGENRYLNEAEEIYRQYKEASTGLTWISQGGYGTMILLFNHKAQESSSAFISDLKNDLKKEADGLLSLANATSYQTTLNSYEWGSNGIMANNGIILAAAYRLFGAADYYAAAQEQLNYLLGKNPLGFSYVSGFGALSPQHVHSRIAVAHNTVLPGALVGGPDSYREDAVTQSLPYPLAPAKVYADSVDSYTTNEIAIYWNSALIFLLAGVIG